MLVPRPKFDPASTRPTRVSGPGASAATRCERARLLSRRPEQVLQSSLPPRWRKRRALAELLLYVGETCQADRRWKGEHDCKSYLAAYGEALVRCGQQPRFPIASREAERVLE